MKKFLLAFIALASPASADNVCVEFADILSEVAVARDMDIPMSHMTRVVPFGPATQQKGLTTCTYSTPPRKSR